MTTVALIFDVDGTLTPSRQQIDSDFKEWFIQFQKTHDVYLVTGSDYSKTLEQVGQEVCDNSKLLFNCCGNEVRRGNEVLYRSSWQIFPELNQALEDELQNSSFSLRTGNHIELRTGLVNFSVVGRNATVEQRKQYIAHDTALSERPTIAARLSNKFPSMEFTIAGETGIDIYPLGKDKSQVLEWIEADRTEFFGDMIVPGGNDWGIAQHADGKHMVTSWQDTHKILMEMFVR